METDHESGREPKVRRYSKRAGIAVLQIGGRLERFRQELSPEQHMVLGDYHRARRGFPSDARMAEVLRVHRTRVAAWKTGDLPEPENARLLAALAVTVDELLRFMDSEAVGDWLTTTQYELGDRTPLEALREGQLAEVLQAVNATEHGAFI